MNTFDAIRERRSIKYFDPSHQFTPAEMDQLIDLAMQAPSSFNIQHWRLVNVTDKSLRIQLRAAASDQAQVTDASLLFVVTVDIKAWDQNPARYWVNAPKEAQEQLQRDEAMRSAGIMLQTLMLAAKGMGYDSCPMVGFDFDKVAELIHLPKDYAIAAMLAIGKGIKPTWPKPGFIPKSEMVIENHF
jgi:nitroreductase